MNNIHTTDDRIESAQETTIRIAYVSEYFWVFLPHKLFHSMFATVANVELNRDILC